MGWIKKIYICIGVVAFIVLCILVNLNVLNVVTVILSAILLSILESSIIFDLEKRLLRNSILVVVMLPINMFISYRVFLNRDYNVVVEYIIFLIIIFVFPIIICIKEFIKMKKSKIVGIYKNDFKIYVKAFIVMLIILDLSVPLGLKQFRDNDLILDRIKIYTIKKDEIYIKDRNNEIRDKIKELIESLEQVKRVNAIEQLNIIKESALEGCEKYSITCNISGHYGNIIFLKDGKVYLKIKKENTFLDGMIGTKNDYYILNLSSQSKDIIDKILNK